MTNSPVCIFRLFLLLSLATGICACTPILKAGNDALPSETAPASETDLSSVPGNAYYFFAKAEISRQAGELEQTVYWLNRAIHADPQSAYLKKELAFIYIYQEAYQKAQDLVNEILKDHPDNMDALVMLAGIHHRKGDSKKAASIYEKVISLDPSLEKIYLILGSIYIENKTYERAAAVYEKLTRQLPDLWDGYFFLGRVNRMLGNFNAAEHNFQKCMALSPRLLSPRFELIDLYQQQGASSESVTVKEGDTVYGLCEKKYGRCTPKMIDQISAANPDIKDINALSTGQTLHLPAFTSVMAMETAEKIISLYQSILDDYPDNYKAAIGLALFYHKRNNRLKAEEMMQSLGNKSRSDLGVVQSLFQSLIETKAYDDARIVVNGMLKGAPESSGLHYMMGIIMDHAREKEKALFHFQQVSNDTRYYENSLVHIAFLYEETGATAEAENAFRQLIQSNPDNPKFHLYLGSLYEREQAYEKAEDLFKQGLAVAPDNVDLMFRLGVVFDKTGRKEAVIEQMQALLEKDPDNASALNYLGYTYAELGENLDEAQSLIEEALRIKPDDPYITDSLGWVFYKKGELDKALETLEKAVRLEPEDPVLLEHLGDAYLKKGDTEKALELYRRSLENSKKGDAEFDPEEIKSKIEQILKKKTI